MSKKGMRVENSQPLYRLRKSGNSHIITIPNNVKEVLNIEEGDMVAFNIGDNGNVEISRADQPIDVDQAIEDTLKQYHDLIEELATL